MAWLIVALLCVQVWGLQHEILHARLLSHVAAAADAAGGDASYDADDPDDAAHAVTTAVAVVAPKAGAHAAPLDFDVHHHHCHLFEGATLAATMATAAWHWGSDAVAHDTPPRATGRAHASATRLPFESRAPPVTV
ncbi:hypothetical protein [Pandoraea pulmonicola]|nr:hypothetical protein [Pandoraea pulmonicola]AJC20645.1 hypothetical protein RO07_09495 [Pandoraea pulmonicola]